MFIFIKENGISMQSILFSIAFLLNIVFYLITTTVMTISVDNGELEFRSDVIIYKKNLFPTNSISRILINCPDFKGKETKYAIIATWIKGTTEGIENFIRLEFIDGNSQEYQLRFETKRSLNEFIDFLKQYNEDSKLQVIFFDESNTKIE